MAKPISTSASDPIQTISAEEMKKLLEEGKKLGNIAREEMDKLFIVHPENMFLVLR